MTLDLAKSATDFFEINRVDPAKGLVGAWDLELVPLALGQLKLPLYWKVDKGGKTEEARTDVSIEVEAPAAPGDDISDIKSPRPARPAPWPWLLALAAGALAYWLWSRLKKEDGEGPREHVVVDHRPPEVIAEEALFTLSASGLWQERRYKDFYLRLTDILRQYLERRYAMPATKLTTAELQRLMRHAELDRALILSFKSVFDRADLVKFSKVEPETSWGERDVENARDLVRRTTPAPARQEAAPR